MGGVENTCAANIPGPHGLQSVDMDHHGKVTCLFINFRLLYGKWENPNVGKML